MGHYKVLQIDTGRKCWATKLHGMLFSVVVKAMEISSSSGSCSEARHFVVLLKPINIICSCFDEWLRKVCAFAFLKGPILEFDRIRILGLLDFWSSWQQNKKKVYHMC